MPPSKKDDVQQGDDVLFINGTLSYIQIDGQWVPSLKLLLLHQHVLPKVTVDMGAVRFVTRGADTMRPGITQLEEFPKDAIVQIIDETHGKPLAIGRAMMSSDEMRAQDSGRVIKAIHYIGDDWWNYQE